MPEPDDIALLRQYAQENSETAFAALVERYVNLVYSTALRRAGSPAAAEEITQAVFILLANKSKSLGGKTVLSGWLYHTAQLTAANFLRGEIRRHRREQEAHMQSTLNESPPETWMQIAPLLEDAMAKLGTRDRDALVLRFFENKNLREVGAAIGTSEDAAKIRVSRALEKLRKIFAKRGVNSTTAAIAGMITAHSVHAAPVVLAKSITATAMTKGVTASSSTLTLIKGTLKTMTWTKLKTVTVVGVVALFAAGTTTVVLQIAKKSSASLEPTAQVSQFQFAGYGTPESSLQSLLWALHTGNLEEVLAAMTPEQAERFRKKQEGKSDNETRLGLVTWANNMIGYRLRQKNMVSDHESRLLLLVPPYPGHPNVGNDLQVMQKIGDDWKYAGKFGVDIKAN